MWCLYLVIFHLSQLYDAHFRTVYAPRIQEHQCPSTATLYIEQHIHCWLSLHGWADSAYNRTDHSNGDKNIVDTIRLFSSSSHWHTVSLKFVYVPTISKTQTTNSHCQDHITWSLPPNERNHTDIYTIASHTLLHAHFSVSTCTTAFSQFCTSWCLTSHGNWRPHVRSTSRHPRFLQYHLSISVPLCLSKTSCDGTPSPASLNGSYLKNVPRDWRHLRLSHVKSSNSHVTASIE